MSERREQFSGESKELDEGVAVMSSAHKILRAMGHDDRAVARIAFAHVCSILKDADRLDLVEASCRLLGEFLISDEIVASVRAAGRA